MIILHLQMSVISNNPTQTASHTDRFGLELLVMLDFSRSFIRKNEKLKTKNNSVEILSVLKKKTVVEPYEDLQDH